MTNSLARVSLVCVHYIRVRQMCPLSFAWILVSTICSIPFCPACDPVSSRMSLTSEDKAVSVAHKSMSCL